ncbi:General stress protein 14 [Azospirillaceae bacterium]
MQILVVMAHPKLDESRIHGAWIKALEGKNNILVNPLYHYYSGWKINVSVEQNYIQNYQRIVLQFPFFLYGCPPLMKKWLDDVLTYRWAYGPGGDALKGKQLLIALSTGGPAESYVRGGYHNYTINELLAPFRQIANLVRADYLPPFVLHRARTMTDQEISASAIEFSQYIQREDLRAL